MHGQQNIKNDKTFTRLFCNCTVSLRTTELHKDSIQRVKSLLQEDYNFINLSKTVIILFNFRLLKAKEKFAQE
jgi:hypothetical protein